MSTPSNNVARRLGFPSFVVLAWASLAAEGSSQCYERVRYDHARFNVAVSGDLMLIADRTFRENGLVYCYSRVDGDWIQTQILSRNRYDPSYGERIATKGRWAAVQSFSHNETTVLYERQGDLWVPHSEFPVYGPILFGQDRIVVVADHFANHEDMTVHTFDWHGTT